MDATPRRACRALVVAAVSRGAPPAYGARKAGITGTVAEMNKNVLYLVVGALVVAVAVIGYMLYEEQQSGVEIEIGEGGVKIEGN
jgi:hypothetical protein